MPFHSYLVQKFDTTHENRYFRDLHLLLEKNFKEEDSSIVLIGNVNIRGHSLDALILKKGAILVIDFKDYQGHLTFSENGPWKLKDKKNKTIFVAGGAKSRNPFQQVNAYRFALFQYLSEIEDKILDNNHDNISWDHTNAIVLFQNKITISNETAIPNKIKRFFHISDHKDIVNLIEDVNSERLQLSDNEIQKILKIIGIEEETKFNPIEIEDAKNKKDNNFSISRMDRIKQLIPDLSSIPKEIHPLVFYNTMLKLERLNDSGVIDVHHYPIDWSTFDSTNFVLNLESIPKFHEVYRKNRENNFPKNLFISVNLNFDGQVVPFFYTIIMDFEIDNLFSIKVNFNEFSLFRKILVELELTEDIIEELVGSINSNSSLKEKINQVSKYLDISLKLDNTISLGLSDETTFTSQLQSELNLLINEKVEIPDNSFFNSFLNNKPFREKLENHNYDLIQITNLNDSQKKAIELSFNQKLTVITGPPGTGKSQVVLNILANSIYKNEKVLFASKNNQAVDNVHDRISNIIDSEYFLRMGSNFHNENLVSKLNKFIQLIKNKKFQNQSQELKIVEADYKSKIDDRNKIKKKIHSIEKIKHLIESDQEKINEINKLKEDFINELNPNYKKLFIDDQLKIDIENSYLNLLENALNKVNSNVFRKVYFRIFQRGKFQKKLIELNNNLSSPIKEFIDNNSPVFVRQIKEEQSFLENIMMIIELKNSSIKISEKFNSYVSKLESIHERKSINELKLSEILNNLVSLKERLKNYEREFIRTGINILKLKINEKLRNSSTQFIESYKSYVENGLPWKDYEKKECSKVIHGFLEDFKNISITSLTVKKSFLLEHEIFDLLVIDEASQCDIASALPLIYRAKRIVIIGDPLQLPHISSINLGEQSYILEKLDLPLYHYNYIKKSLFDYCYSLSIQCGMESEFLKEHYRCHPDIIGFSNHYFYKLIAGQALSVETDEKDFSLGHPGIHWLHVNGSTQKSRNINEAEANKCFSLVKRLLEKFPEAKIGVVTPFKHQKLAIKDLLSNLPNSDSVVCDTVHKFQGDEKDIIVMSLVVTNNSRQSLSNFINYISPYILNVAVTRAKSSLIIIGNNKYCLSLVDDFGRTFLANLAHYTNIINSKN